jgi:predicted dehydrogenase
MSRLGIGFVGSGFNTKFHLRAFTGVRDADVHGIYSPTRRNAEEAATLARDLELGDTRAFRSIGDMVADPRIDAIWLCGPNHARVENVEEIVEGPFAYQYHLCSMEAL